MINKQFSQKPYDLQTRKQNKNCKTSSLSTYKTIAIKNSAKYPQRSQLHIKSRLGAIANTLPQIPIKSNRQCIDIISRNAVNNRESQTSIKILKNPNNILMNKNRQTIFARRQILSLSHKDKNIKSLSIKKDPNIRPINRIKTKELKRQGPPKIKQKRQEISRINQNLIFQRRQNYLNSFFNQRKNKLQQINKQNKKIYERINSQKSLYSSQQLNKSYEFNCSISSSKVSNRSRLSSVSKSIKTSRATVKNQKTKVKQTKNQIKQNKNLITIQYQNIKNLKAEQVNKFTTLFNKVSRPLKSFSKENYNVLHPISNSKPIRFTAKQKKLQQNVQIRQKTRSMFGQISNCDGGLLHRIIEEDPINKGNRIKLGKIIY